MDPATEDLIATHMGLAQSLAHKVYRTAPHALELDEVRAIANLGLVQAAERWLTYCEKNNFDPARLEYFKPYVARRVYGGLIDAIRASDWATRSLRTKARALIEAGQDKGATESELAQRSGMSIAEVRATIRGMAQRPVSLEAEDLDPSTTYNVESTAFTAVILGTVVDAVRDLAHDQQIVVALHYHQGMQLQEIARAMGITESRASQLHAKAVLTIHEAMLAAATHHEKDPSGGT